MSPIQGWLKENIDTACKEGRAALALVIRDRQARLIFMGSKVMEANFPAQAELKVLHWGLQVTEFHKWQRIVRSMDTKQVVDELTSIVDPSGWDSRFDFVV